MKKYLPIAATLLLFSQISQATSAACMAGVFANSQMLNVSTSGWASREEPLVTCTIINPLVSNNFGFGFLSETSNDDAILEIKYVDKPFPHRMADNWKESLSPVQQQGLISHLRAPARDSDAALIMHIDTDRYRDAPALSENAATHRFGVCAFGYPKNGRAWTSVSISSFRQNTCPWFNVSPVLYFEK